MVNYYPKDIDLSMSKFAKEWPELELVNFAEAQRLWDVDMKKARGKGAPAKAKDKSVSHSDIIWNVTQVIVSRPESPDTEKTVDVWITSHIQPFAFVSTRENQHVPFIPAASINGSDRLPISEMVFENRSLNPCMNPALSNTSW